MELLVGRKKRGVEDDAESEVLSWSRYPIVASLSDSGSLFQSPIASEVLHLREVEGFTIAIGRLNRVQYLDFQFSIRLT